MNYEIISDFFLNLFQIQKFEDKKNFLKSDSHQDQNKEVVSSKCQ